MIHDLGDDKAINVRSDVGKRSCKCHWSRPMAPASGVVLVSDTGSVCGTRFNSCGGEVDDVGEFIEFTGFPGSVDFKIAGLIDAGEAPFESAECSITLGVGE